MERVLGEKGGYNLTLLWVPGREKDASVCITGPDMQTAHIPMERWWDFAKAVDEAYVDTLVAGDRMFEEDEA